ncbi:MAG TPA: TfoX/Sxy family protein [Steroidobacteraceae bacterium]|jgi:DNA transformation protein|nr:TfoX/Sxy family protein [Steroidobacteraceae bacterium]
MPVSADYRDFILEQLAGAGRVTSRAMFGGVGLYLDGLFFALIDDDTLYFKADEASRRRYEAAGSRPFCPDPSRPEQAMGYWQVPADVLEDPEALVDWAREAQGVALSKRGKRVTRRRSPAARRVSRR